jgi:hypothetical protein
MMNRQHYTPYAQVLLAAEFCLKASDKPLIVRKE